MPNPSAYIETTVVGHLTGRILDDPIIAGRQKATLLWWPIAMKEYELFVSSVVADECSAGNADAALERMEIVNPKTRAAIERVCEEAGFSPPMICTPDELLES